VKTIPVWSESRPVTVLGGRGVWRHVAPAFAKDYRIVLFDYVGAGKSDLKANDASRYSALEGYATDILEIIHALDLRDVMDRNFIGWAN
jgi:pimeloyl-ACP methyl ester carboxylesterase